jgi:hypothetical protein
MERWATFGTREDKFAAVVLHTASRKRPFNASLSAAFTAAFLFGVSIFDGKHRQGFLCGIPHQVELRLVVRL